MNDWVRIARSKAAQKPKKRASTGFVKCHNCQKQLLEGEEYYVQWQKGDDERECCVKECISCVQSNRLFINFEPWN